ncbi:MAG: N-6 DNA methylase [Anaerolineales bacterium]|nr:N-6 DNA methylase [Anaerolineales bacterium]
MSRINNTLKNVRIIFQKANEVEILPFIEGTTFLLLLVFLKEQIAEAWSAVVTGEATAQERFEVSPENLGQARSLIGQHFYPAEEAATNRDLVPTPPLRLDREGLGKALFALHQLCQQDGISAGSVFNEYLLAPPNLTTMLPGKRYPTPRHIVRHMAQLVQIQADNHVADLACGSGSYLIATLQPDKAVILIGFEISGNWARLAWTNAILHGLSPERFNIYPHSSLQGATPPDEEKLYQRLLMNPAFGNSESSVLVKQALGNEATATASETVLTELAIKRLADNGRGMVLVPTGVLFRNSTAERTLRRRLVETCTLHTVVSFPKDRSCRILGEKGKYGIL